MQGRRLPDGTSDLAPGDYAKGLDGVWYCRPPGDADDCLLGSLRGHQVTEHEDGTITAAPSILVKWDGLIDGFSAHREWHGYLERGVWRTC